VAGSRTGAGPGPAGKATTAAVAVLLLLVLAGTASAATGGAPSPGGGSPPPASPTGSPAAGAPSSGALSLTSARVSPPKAFYYGVRYPRLTFTIGSDQPQNDLQIDVVNTAGEAVRSFYRNGVAPNTTIGIRWDGTTAAGRPAARRAAVPRRGPAARRRR
jgi:hypothetical protein